MTRTDRQQELVTEALQVLGVSEPTRDQRAAVEAVLSAATEALDAGRAPAAGELQELVRRASTELHLDPAAAPELDAWLAELADAAATFRKRELVDAKDVVPVLGRLWARYVATAEADGAWGLVGRVLLSVLGSTVRSPLVIFRPADVEALRKAGADEAACERLWAEKIREAMVCFCGEVAERVESRLMNDTYRCSSCGKGMVSEWHELAPFYEAAPELPPLTWVRVTEADRLEAAGPPLPVRLFAVLESGKVALLDAERGKLGTLAVGRSPVAVGVGTPEGFVVALKDGTLVRGRVVRDRLRRVGRQREDGHVWLGVAEVLYDDRPVIAAVEERLGIVLFDPVTFEDLDVIPLWRTLPTAMVAHRGVVIVGSAEGLLTRIRLASPERWETYFAPVQRTAISELVLAGGDLLAALTETGDLWSYQARHPALPPECWAPRSGRKLAHVAAFDAGRVLGVDDEGGLHLVAPEQALCVELPVRVEARAVGLARLGAHVVTVHASGVMCALPILDDGPEPRLGEPRRVALGEPAVATFC